MIMFVHALLEPQARDPFHLVREEPDKILSALDSL